MRWCNSNIVLLVALLLTGCDFFYSEVPFKGSEQAPRLAVSARLTPDVQRIYVSESSFFLDDMSAPHYVSDAVVELWVNDGAKQVAQYMNGAYEVPLLFHAADRVGLRVTHPRLGSAMAEQVCPAPIQATLQVDSLSRYGEMYCTVDMSAYEGADDDMVAVVAGISHLHAVVIISSPWGDEVTDTLHHWANDGYEYACWLYSADTLFAQQGNRRAGGTLYAGRTLHLSPNKQRQTLHLQVDPHLITIDDTQRTLRIDSMEMNIYLISRTHDDYVYYQSLERQTNAFGRVPDPTSYNASDEDVEVIDVAALLEELQDTYSTLGSAEGNQAYGNLLPANDAISGTNSAQKGAAYTPLGCFSIVNTTRCSYVYKASPTN